MDKKTNKVIEMYQEDAERSLLREYGKPRMMQSANPMQIYLSRNPGFPDPSYIEYPSRSAISFDFAGVYDALVSNGWETELQFSVFTVGEMERPNEIYMCNPEIPGYMIQLTVERQRVPRKRKKNLKKLSSYRFKNGVLHADTTYEPVEGDELVVDELILYMPKKGSPCWNPQIAIEINEILSSNSVKNTNPEEAEINIVTVTDGQYEVKSFSIQDANTSFTYPDLHYGEGFGVFHQEMLERITDEKKGLVLLHGEPGTGKTQYIRHMLKELCAANKAVLYSPPSVTASLAEPQMINFISNWIMDESRDCILLIEDAEPLLESRGDGSDGRSTGISNLLNMTDGILNDILGLMVIATFNIDIRKIDPALLRSGRLIARKEFKKLTKAQAKDLAQALEINLSEDASYPMSIADFYNSDKSNKILVHDYAEKKSTIGFHQ